MASKRPGWHELLPPRESTGQVGCGFDPHHSMVVYLICPHVLHSYVDVYVSLQNVKVYKFFFFFFRMVEIFFKNILVFLLSKEKCRSGWFKNYVVVEGVMLKVVDINKGGACVID